VQPFDYLPPINAIIVSMEHNALVQRRRHMRSLVLDI